MSLPVSPALPLGANDPLDLEACAQEPIHIPGSIQPHGVLFALDAQTLKIVQYSANAAELLGLPQVSLAGRSLEDALGPEQSKNLPEELRALTQGEPIYLRTILTEGAGHRTFELSAHRTGAMVIVELEPTASSDELSYRKLHPLVQSFFAQSRLTASLDHLMQLAVDQVRAISGFDRVLLYKFDPDWNGHVLAESRTERYSSYLDLWFPASDIPEQARKLYTLNRFRLIADANYRPSVLEPANATASGAPLDLTFSSLRSVSPVHIEYLKNMDVVASMSISILTNDGRLWGLIACHHSQARHLPIEVRTALDFIAQTLSVQIEAGEERAEYLQRLELSWRTAQLLEFMTQEDNFINGLLQHPDELLGYAQASGGAVLYEGKCTLLGDAPNAAQVMGLVNWLIGSGRPDAFSTHQLPAEFPPAKEYAAKASGVLAVPISQIHNSYILWFRPEVVSTVKWSGDPRKAVEQNSSGPARLHPRKSFEAWSQTVRGRSTAWSAAEIDAVSRLRGAIVSVVLRKAEELAELSDELKRSNSELAAFSYSVSHDLRAPFRHIVGYAELLRKSTTAQLGERDIRYMNTIIESAQFAGTLVDNLLSFSQVGRARLQIRRVDMAKLVSDVQRDLEMEVAGRNVEWKIGPLPSVEGDYSMLRIVWQNLIQNAIKYTRPAPIAVISISSSENDEGYTFRIKDNGVGFDQQYAEKLFGVFQRLHRMEDFEGTGIGLANVRRIVTRHGGQAWGEGKVSEGATFYFTLPRQIKIENHDVAT